MKVVAYVPGLMDRSRFNGLPAEIVFVNSPSDLSLAARDADIAVADLSKPGVTEVLAQLTARTIGFVSHVEREQIAAAKAAGVDEVMPRSKFFTQLATLLN